MTEAGRSPDTLLLFPYSFQIPASDQFQNKKSHRYCTLCVWGRGEGKCVSGDFFSFI